MMSWVFSKVVDPRHYRAWMYLLVVTLGVFHFCTYMRLESFAPDSSYYIGLARSILERGRYEFNFIPHVFYPPGYPLLLASIGIFFGVSYFVAVRAAAIVGMLGLIASYELLRVKQGKGVAAAGCLILGFSGFYFYMAAQLAGSDVPYFFTSMLLLLLVARVEQAWMFRRPRLLTSAAVAVLIVLSLLMRTVGVALLAGLLAWVGVRWLRDKKGALDRAKFFAPAILLALIVFGGWMAWTQEIKSHYASELGATGTYVDQFWLIDPHHPELGQATAADLIKRAGEGLLRQGSHVTAIMTSIAWVEPKLYSPLVLVPLVLAFLGWLSSVRHNGGELTEWYFAAYLGIYLLWPFDVGPRFIFPVFPLVFLYLCRGGMEIARVKPWSAAFFFPSLSIISLIVGIYGATVVFSHWNNASLQAKASAAFWLIIFACSGLATVGPRSVVNVVSNHAMALFSRPGSRKMLGGLTVGVLVVAGLASQARGVAYNLQPKVSEYVHRASKEAADWIAGHTAPSDVVMAQQVSILHRVSARRIVPFPARSDPGEIMSVIRQQRVKYLVAITGKGTVLSPSEAERSAKLQSAFSDEVRLVRQQDGYVIYEITDLRSAKNPS